MDSSERLAFDYLVRCGFSSVEYEPDGNIPPDFLADGRVAVEVRRLDQAFTSREGHTKGLDELSVPMWQRMKKLLPTIGPVSAASSWWVSIQYQRPLGCRLSALDRKIREALLAFLEAPSDRISEIAITENVSLTLHKADRAGKCSFMFAAASDHDAGGFILAETLKHLLRCSQEKEEKVLAYRSRYPEWWLILPDHIGLGVSAEDVAEYRSALTFPHSWDRIVLLDPRGSAPPFEF